MGLYYAKLTCLTIILFGNFFIGICPLYILSLLCKNDQEGCRRKRAIALFIFFGGGVFMANSFLYLQPKANEEYEIYLHEQSKESKQDEVLIKSDSKGHEESFPIPELISVIGFFLAFAIEEVLQILCTGFQKKPSSSAKTIPFCSCAKRHTECSKAFKTDIPKDQSLLDLEKQPDDFQKHEDALNYYSIKGTDDATVCTERGLLQSSVIAQPIPNYGAITDGSHDNDKQHIPVITSPLVFEEDGKITIVKSQTNLTDYAPFTTYLLLAIALIIYNIFQGISLGHLEDTFSWGHLIFCIQQFIVSFAVGGIISKDSEATLSAICYVGLLSIMCPLGVSTTMLFNDAVSNIPHVAGAILNSILCGTFLYVTFFDFLRGNIVHNAPSMGKFVLFLLGFVLTSGLQYISFAIS